MDIILIATLVLVVGIVGCIIMGVPIAVGIGLSSFAAAMVLLDFDRAALVSAQRMFTGINSFTLLAIPFFVLAGVLMNSGGVVRGRRGSRAHLGDRLHDRGGHPRPHVRGRQGRGTPRPGADAVAGRPVAADDRHRRGRHPLRLLHLVVFIPQISLWLPTVMGLT